MKCHDSRLNTLLHADEDSPEYRQASGHVEACSQCQQRLLQLSGDEGLLREVSETLQISGDTEDYDGRGATSVIVSVDAGFDDDVGAECEPLSLDFLSPAGHPEMLGRIGRYEVERVIGSGGMGIVLKGFDTELHRVVAIKVLKPHLANNGAARRRFAREAQSAAAVVHEHVIPIHDVHTDGDMPFLVMQYVPGQSLQARVDERGPLDAKEVLRIGRQIAAGLAAAHAQGVVHRDVKPANILLEETVDRVLISDFGLARTVDDATLTHTGVVAGTPHYMSPEQASGHTVDQRSDLFSLGSVIYFMCTGRPPFRAEHALAILNRICRDEHRPVEEVNSDVPAELADVIDQLLAKNSTDRFSDAFEAERSLENLLQEQQKGRAGRIYWRRVWRRRRRVVRRCVMILSVVAACITGGAVLSWWLMQPATQPVAQESRTQPVPEPRANATPEARSHEQQNSAEQALPNLSAEVFPPDAFASDIATVDGQLRAIETMWDSGSLTQNPQVGQTEDWHSKLEEARCQMDGIEANQAGNQNNKRAITNPWIE